VELETLGGETLIGSFIYLQNEKNYRVTNASILFENGETARLRCSTSGQKRSMSIYYDAETYSFTNQRQETKEELDAYRRQFIDFIVGVYETGDFPSREEILASPIYTKYTNCYKYSSDAEVYRWDTLKKATVKSVYEDRIALNVNGQAMTFEEDQNTFVALIKNGALQRLKIGEVRLGKCLIAMDSVAVKRIYGLYIIDDE
jgi:hypothetical protein